MTWHLKDRELENKLIAIDTDFIERLNQNCEIWNSNHDEDLCELMHFEQILRYKNKLLGNLLFTGVQLEKVPEYNPHAWNEYPAVTPPDNVLMRLEFTETESTGKPKRHHVAATFNGITWGTRDSSCASVVMTKCRFRPWNED